VSRGFLVKGLATALLTAASAALLFSQNGASRNSEADDLVLKAMRDEMDRSRQLKVVSGGDPPYFISYGLTEADTYRTAAQLGAVILASRNRFRSPSIEVRVGSYEFDHTGRWTICTDRCAKLCGFPPIAPSRLVWSPSAASAER